MERRIRITKVQLCLQQFDDCVHVLLMLDVVHDFHQTRFRPFIELVLAECALCFLAVVVCKQ